jgi:hypothetical protein
VAACAPNRGMPNRDQEERMISDTLDRYPLAVGYIVAAIIVIAVLSVFI